MQALLGCGKLYLELGDLMGVTVECGGAIGTLLAMFEAGFWTSRLRTS